MLDDNGQPMHSMIALYWKAGEYVEICEEYFDKLSFCFFSSRVMREKEICIKKDRSSVSVESFQTKCSLKNTILTKIFIINEYDKIIFARYNSYIMLPWFTIANILSELDEEKIKNFVNFFKKKFLEKFFVFS